MKKTSRIYVAGHTGLVGSALIRALRARSFTNLITRTHKALDLTQQGAVERFFKKERPEYVFVAAAKVGGIHANNTYPAEFIQQNLAIQTHVLDMAYKYGVKKLLLLASSCIYPKRCRQPMKEDQLFTGLMEPTNEPYGVAKLAGIKMCEAYNRQYGTQFVPVIPANAYGPNDHFGENGHVLAALVAKFHEAKSKNKKKVTLWGTGKPKREFFFVDDLADACLFLMERYREIGVINFGPGVETSIAQLAKRIQKVVGWKGDIEFDTTRPDGNPRRLLDSSRIRALGWSAKVPLEDGLRITYDWYTRTQVR
ncbi:GDP-L-fucose synthetase [Nitrospina gracilis 3/211]|uniref:GDP-L-fucose synthase n=1 Tax=Nitrospina gracilis (strain 3/211) TaxID=1266370 RepID=M1YVX7_NITG3|nr:MULTISPECIES: GDP-L-fucose synthase [Nitrospina]MCF8722832.1 GDP-L-fucose synthase [Nitrospina sp. Nb-3]CCQ89790.1 GDP-L-fucose synthetase [Nitrospina gracilis 3/211]